MTFLALYMSNPLPKITFIIVKKRHNTRFFVRDSNTGNINNVQPGMFEFLYEIKMSLIFIIRDHVVDTDIVHPRRF